jgi:serine-type D-Ala-D-Ala carboxypeptidase (penicillin-binding protein 5/6)
MNAVRHTQVPARNSLGKGLFALGCLALALTGGPGTAPAADFDTSAKEAILLDYDTGAVLFEKNPDEAMHPASMTKIMTALMAFEQLQAGSLSLEDELPVSEEAWRKGGSRMFVQVGTSVKVSDLLQGIIVQSGNDASIVLAEGLAGNEPAFADLMTEKARAIGMTHTVFRNSTGWPDDAHVTTSRDMAILAKYVITNYPELYAIYSEKEYTYGTSPDGKPITQSNRNPLLYRLPGTDGLKTGHTEASGYGLTASVKRGDRRLIMVINGLDSVKARADESQRLVEWGFREFDNYQLFTAGETVTQADVWLGDMATVPLVIKDDLAITLPRSARRDMKVTVTYEGPLPAPISAGTQVATLHVTVPDMAPVSMPLVTGTEVGQLDFMGRISSAIGHIVWGAAGG